MKWMQYQSPDEGNGSSLPTSDWRDEQYVMGLWVYHVNMLSTPIFVFICEHESADQLRGAMSIWRSGRREDRYEQEALVEPSHPTTHSTLNKVMSSDRFRSAGTACDI